MRIKTLFLCIIVLCIAIAGLMKLVSRRAALKRQQQPNVQVEAPEKPAPAAPSEPKEIKPEPARAGPLRLADDAEQKAGDCWIEQLADFSPELLAGLKPDQDLVSLFTGYEVAAKRGLRLRLTGSKAFLEEVEGSEARVLADAAIEKLPPGEHTLGALLRGKKLTLWLDARELFSANLNDANAALLKQPSGTQVHVDGLVLGARRTVAQNQIRFDDSFMRTGADGNWKPQFGRWELTQLAFPERSANPFSLRASFGTENVSDDKLFQGRIRDNDREFGLGVMISPFEGTLHIERITGGSPAARAGLAEDDIFLEVDGIPISQLQQYQVMQMLHRGYRGDVRLKMLRPGENKPRDFHITKDFFHWGTPAEGIAIAPNNDPGAIGTDRFALVFGGDAGWTDYAAEVAIKPLGAGGAGLAFAALSADEYMLFRWRGTAERGTAPTGATDRLELVRVQKGQETVLASRDGGYRPYEFYRMSVDWNGETVRCLIDGNEVLKQNVPGLTRGKIGLYALKGEPVFFDDVHVAVDRALLTGAVRPEVRINSIFAAEDNMSVWGNPALEWKRDLITGWAVHQARFPGEQIVVLTQPLYEDLSLSFFCGDEPADGRVFVRLTPGRVKVESTFGCALDEKCNVGPFKRIAIRASLEGVEIDLDGTVLRATGEIKKLPHIPVDQQRVAIKGLKNLGKPETARVWSTRLLEYGFDSAPADWKVESGRWGLLNKWICDPRWSWFGGRTRTVASLWNKNVFSGDISVDAHVALMMQREEPPFERPGDYNITICGDGLNLDSGYTLIYGGDGNSWTRLYRKGKLVAESSDEAHRLFSDRIRHPDKPDLHQRWFNIRLEKSGDTVSFYRDGAKAFSFKDPEPLDGGRVAFWTLDNGFLLSRVRIAHGGATPAPFEARRAKLYEDGRIINLYDGEIQTAVTAQTLPPAIRDSLKSPRKNFAPATAPALPADAAKAIAPEAGGGGSAEAWRVENAAGGGPFCVQFKGALLDPEQRGVLRFAYRIEPGANVDLYLVDVSERGGNPRYTGAYRWRMTGPKESNEFAPLAGEVPGIVADGAWHTVQCDLQPGWRALWKDRGFNRVQRPSLRLMIGNLDNGNYLLAGMNANHAGASYSISDIQILSPQDIDDVPPKVAKTIWPYDADGDGRSVKIVFDDASGSGVLEESLQVTVGGVAVPRELQTYDDRSSTLIIELPLLNIDALAQKPELKLQLLGFQDRAGNKQQGYEAAFKFEAAKAAAWKGALRAPRIGVEIVGDVSVTPGSGALRLMNVQSIDAGARLQDSTDAPPWAPEGERQSLLVSDVIDGSAFGFTAGDMNYNLRNWPYLLLDYKIPFETPVNLHFNDQYGSNFALMLTDIGDARDPESRDIQARFGPPADFSADGTWRRSIIPFQRLFLDGSGQGPGTEVRNVSFFDNGWRGNRRGMQYWIHRIQPLPSARADVLRFGWHTESITGVETYATSIDEKPESDPGEKQDVRAGELLGEAIRRNNLKLKDGWNYLHVKVKDATGRWSAVAHQPFHLDNTPPRVALAPQHAGGILTGQTVRMIVDDPSGVESGMLRISVNGKVIGSGWRGVSYDRGDGVLTLDASRAGMTFDDGQKVTIELQNVKDLIGNTLPVSEPLVLTVDHAKDKIGPTIEQIRVSSQVLGQQLHRQMQMETSFGLDFEEHTGHVFPIQDCSMEVVRVGALFGKRAVKLTALDSDVNFEALLHRNAWWIDHAPMVQFDYVATPGMVADLKVEVLGEWYTIRFLGNGGEKPIGRVEDAVADGNVRHASVDLRTLLENAIPNWPYRLVNKIILSTHGQAGLKRGSSILLDNLDVTGAGGSGRFEWKASDDPSGILGYATVLDQKPGTVPPEVVNTLQTVVPAAGRNGVWYLHVRATDQANNWGPVRHFRVDFGGER